MKNESRKELNLKGGRGGGAGRIMERKKIFEKGVSRKEIRIYNVSSRDFIATPLNAPEMNLVVCIEFHWVFSFSKIK